MELFSLAILAHLLDPIRALVTLASILLWRGPLAILIAAGVSAIACETILTAVNIIDDFTYEWGEGIGPGAVACLAQAVVLYPLVTLVRHRRSFRAPIERRPPATRTAAPPPHHAPLAFGRPEPAE